MADSTRTPKSVRLEPPAEPTAENNDTEEAKPKDDVAVEALHPSAIGVQLPLIDTSIARAAVTDPLRTYVRVQASNPWNIANQARHTLYHRPGDQALYGSSATSLLAIENILLMSWQNPSAATANYSESYTIGFTTSTSTEVSAAIGLAPSFNGISLWNAEGSYKRVTTEETQESTTRTVTVTVPPRSDVYFYQRRYYFSTDVYFTLDAWMELSVAGSNGGYHVQRATILSHIDATEYLTTSTRLSGTTTANFSSQNLLPWFGQHARMFQNLTRLARDTLTGIGINGSQQG